MVTAQTKFYVDSSRRHVATVLLGLCSGRSLAFSFLAVSTSTILCRVFIFHIFVFPYFQRPRAQ